LPVGQPHPVGEWDTVQLHEGVELRRGDRPATEPVAGAASVMGDAPTMALRLPHE
jgi:hypothetical protein